MSRNTEQRRDVFIAYTDGRTDKFTGVTTEVSKQLEDLPFDKNSGVNSSSSVPSRSNRRD
ncbi:MAG TPA: hypothetical protein VGX23_14210 [Actinocrinis sp.]|nr:hypothetical protein [Actinocrinis sp.]